MNFWRKHRLSTLEIGPRVVEASAGPTLKLNVLRFEDILTTDTHIPDVAYVIETTARGLPGR